MKAQKHKGRFFLLFSLSVIFAVLSQTGQAPAVKPEKDIRGETFTNPSKKFQMPKEWVSRPIKYEKDDAGADLVIVMDQDIYYTLLPVIRKFEKENNLKIIVKEGTCGIAGGMLAEKTADMGGFCCPPGAEDRLPGIKFYTMGIVGKAFLVNAENPVDNISSSDLREIYKGRINHWTEIKDKNGRPGPQWRIRAIARLHCQKRPGHWRQLLDNSKLFGPGVFEVGSIPDMIKRVSSTQGAIGWEVLTMVEKNKRMGTVKAISIDGYRPQDSEALLSLKYPFYRTYNLSTWEGKGIENKHARKLVDYLIREFEKLPADRFGFVSQSRLRKAGWKFIGDELVGEPKQKK